MTTTSEKLNDLENKLAATKQLYYENSDLLAKLRFEKEVINGQLFDADTDDDKKDFKKLAEDKQKEIDRTANALGVLRKYWNYLVDQIAKLGSTSAESDETKAKERDKPFKLDTPEFGEQTVPASDATAKPPTKPIDPLDRSPFDLPAVERKVNDLWRSRNDPAPKNQPDPLDTMPPVPPAPPAEPPKRRTLADMIGEMAERRRQDRQADPTPLAIPDPVPPIDDFGADLDTDASNDSKPFSQPVFDEIIPLPRNPTFREVYYHKASKHQVEERQRRQRKLKPQ